MVNLRLCAFTEALNYFKGRWLRRFNLFCSGGELGLGRLAGSWRTIVFTMLTVRYHNSC